MAAAGVEGRTMCRDRPPHRTGAARLRLRAEVERLLAPGSRREMRILIDQR